MLLAMEQPIATPPSPASPSFAGLLAALAASAQNPALPSDRSSAPGRKSGIRGSEFFSPEWKAETSVDQPSQPKQKPAPAWNDDDLADDIATLSYERALRTHSRYRAAGSTAAESSNPLPAEPAEPEPIGFEESFPSAPSEASQPAHPFSVKPEREPASVPGARLERNLKDASITIRLSKAECAQLHRRAAEAGLTVSAYLRSCTFEAESLREMVKDTLLQLRSATTPAQPAAPAAAEPQRPAPFRGRSGWMARLLNSRQDRQQAAHA
jgi:hypothetical protein